VLAAVQALGAAWEALSRADVDALLYMHEGDVRVAVRQWLKQKEALAAAGA
jgi:hypothetical protein